MKTSRFIQFSTLLYSSLGSINRMKRHNMEAFDLEPAHTMCLSLLYHHTDGMTKTRISELCEVDKAQVTRVIADLQKKGLVLPLTQEKGYKKKLMLSERGLEIASQIDRAILEINSYVSDSIPPEQIENFYITFTTICENLKKAEKNFIFHTEESK